ncbi:hypothetical protein ACU4GD_00555 [Cupriavidus basilensis]
MVDAIAASVISAVPGLDGPFHGHRHRRAGRPVYLFHLERRVLRPASCLSLPKRPPSMALAPLTIGRASLIGQRVHLLQSTGRIDLLLVGLAEVEFGDHQRYRCSGPCRRRWSCWWPPLSSRSSPSLAMPIDGSPPCTAKSDPFSMPRT